MGNHGLESPKAVICLAVFNGKAFLAELLNSLVVQSMRIDIVIRDDGSSDGSIGIIRDYSSKYSFIHVLENKKENSGSASLNFSTLLEEVVAREYYEYYFFADQDDIWRTDKVELILSKMALLEAEHPQRPILLHSDLEVVNKQLIPIAGSFFSYQGLNPFNSTLSTVLVENPATGCAMAFNHQLATVVLPISDNAIMHDWWFSLVAYAVGAHVEIINESLVKYRQHSENTLGAKKMGPGRIIKVLFGSRSVSLDRYYTQVRSLLNSEKIEVKDDVRVFLEAFLSTEDLGAMKRLSFFLKYRIYKSSIVKNIGLLVLTIKR